MNTAMKLFAGLALAGTATLALADPQVTAISVSVSASATSVTEVARPMPDFPVSAQRDGIHSGRVLLGYAVGPDGSVQDVRVLSAHPVQVFTRSAVNAVKQWRYIPGSTDKRMVEFTFTSE